LIKGKGGELSINSQGRKVKVPIFGENFRGECRPKQKSGRFQQRGPQREGQKAVNYGQLRGAKQGRERVHGEHTLRGVLRRGVHRGKRGGEKALL